MNVFISGGCKNGKSMYAQQLARSMATEQKVPLYYIATMIPKDDEDIARIQRHLQAREGWGFTTVEVGTGLLSVFDEKVEPPCDEEGHQAVDPAGAFLLDSVTALLSNEMFREDGSYDPDAGERLAEELVRFAKKTGNTVFVSDFIYSDARRYDDMTENYRRALALCDRRLAQVCDRCVEVSYTTINDFR